MHYFCVVVVPKEVEENDIQNRIDEMVNALNEEMGSPEFYDSWAIGGRYYNKWFTEYNPKTDPTNYETCWLCKGKGTRLISLCNTPRLHTSHPNEIRAPFPPIFTDVASILSVDKDGEALIKCNGCTDGVKLKYPSQWKVDWETVSCKVKDIPTGKGKYPALIITPDFRDHLVPESWDMDDIESRILSLVECYAGNPTDVLDNHSTEWRELTDMISQRYDDSESRGIISEIIKQYGEDRAVILDVHH